MRKISSHKRSRILPVVIIAFLPALSGYGCGATRERFERGCRPDIEPPEDSYDTTSVRSISGRIYKIESIFYDDKISTVNFSVAADDGKRYFVQVAPSWYLELKKTTFKEGESVIVTGYFTDLNEEEEEYEEEEEEDIQGENPISQIIVTREIRKRGRTLPVRDMKGKPLWYRKGMLRGRQLYIKRHLEDKKAGRETEGTLPRGLPKDIDPRSFPPPPAP
jgi:hypothetical protein